MNEEKKKAVQALKTVAGQVEGIVRMIEDGRYCIEVSNQIFAAAALLKKANMLVLKQHMNHCVKDAVTNGDAEEKISEMLEILSKVLER